MGPEKTDILRLPKRHEPKVTTDVTAADGERLLRAQSMRDAIIAGLVAVIVFCILLAMLSALIDRIFPWFPLLLGLVVGLVVRRAGNGLDWRFPSTAAVLVVVGALIGNVLVAATFTAAEFETGTLTILGAVTSMTWPVFFTEVMTPPDLVYALFGAAVAAFYANRRLARAEFLALRKWEKEHGGNRPT